MTIDEGTIDEGMKFAFIVAAIEESPYWDPMTEEAAEATWDEWIARVKRDAAREALDGLVQKFQWGGWSDTLKRGSQPIDLMGNANRVTGWMRDYRDTHYPEETP